MKITRLHLIFIILILFAVSLFTYPLLKEKIGPFFAKKNKPVAEQPVEGQSVTQEEIVAQEPQVEEQAAAVDFESEAKKGIAVAGEYWKKNKREGRDVANGQRVLRQAKEKFAQKSYEESLVLANDSVELFKLAGYVQVKSAKARRVIASKPKNKSKTKFSNKGSQAKSKTYRVRKGDTLWGIAKRKDVYGRGAMWVKIWRNNESGISDFDKIVSGTVLKIPKLKKNNSI